MEFRLLGPVEVRHGGEVLALGGPRQRAVLGVLALRANEVVTVRTLVEAVWETAPASADTNIRTYVAALRRLLREGGESGERLVTRPAGYLFAAAPDEVDVLAFEELAGRGDRALAERNFVGAAGFFERALVLWRGEPLEDLELGPGPLMDIVRLRERRLAVAERHARALVGVGRHADVVAHVRPLLTRHPLRDGLWEALISALFQAGHHAEALDTYERMRTMLAEELGSDPTPALRRLHQRILTAGPAVSGRGSAGVPEPIPRQLPAPPASFTGRTAELATLTGVLDKAAAAGGTVVISALSGAGGMGKTWLALRWAQQHLDEFPDGQLFIDLRGFAPDAEPLAPSAALKSFLQGLGVAPGLLPADDDALAGLYRSRVAGRRMLIVLDNAYGLEQVAPLLPGSPTCTVLVTSRDRLTGLVTAHGAHLLPVDVLPESEARELLARRLGAERLAAEPEVVDDLLAHCGGYPLALAIIAGRAAAHPEFPLRTLADELCDGTARLAALDEGDPTADLSSVLSWSYTDLPAAEAEMFALLGSAPGTELGVPAVAALAAVPDAKARTVLRALERASLVQQSVPGRWRMHDLVHLYASERADQDLSPHTREAALDRLLGFYLHTAENAERLINPDTQPLRLGPPGPGVEPLTFDDESSSLAWFDTEHTNLLAALRLAVAQDRHRSVWQFALALDAYHVRRGHLHEDLAAWQAALNAADHLDDPESRALAHRHLGVAHADLARYDEALEHFREALALAEQADDLAGQARTHHTLAWAWGRRGEYRPAREHATRALHMFQALGNHVRAARTLNQVGWYSTRLGEHTEARGACETALEAHRRHHDREGEAHTLDSLGHIAHHTGRLPEALEYYRQALALYRDLGHTYSEADTLDRLGHTHLTAGRANAARVTWQQALDLYHAQHRTEQADQVRHQLSVLDEHNGPDMKEG
ncbi:BTAD domain-containing putative transcriptional regulator [Streptomyces sp. NPDC007851]|uniref:AfsR/SARP family transcriptional regulator n=1 Tax=Streptomyces sp. NPDC007851 TaxID=3155008 RepID=UPI0034008286